MKKSFLFFTTILLTTLSANFISAADPGPDAKSTSTADYELHKAIEHGMALMFPLILERAPELGSNLKKLEEVAEACIMETYRLAKTADLLVLDSAIVDNSKDNSKRDFDASNAFDVISSALAAVARNRETEYLQVQHQLETALNSIIDAARASRD